MAVNVVIGLYYYLAWAASLYARPAVGRRGRTSAARPPVVPRLLVADGVGDSALTGLGAAPRRLSVLPAARCSQAVGA